MLGKATSAQQITVHFIDPNVEGLPRRQSVVARVGESLVDVAKANNVDIHAACGQKLQCATCHVILPQHVYSSLNPPGVREGDLLESTFLLTDTSRLGCQVRLTSELDNLECTLPFNGAKGAIRMSLEQPRPQVRSASIGIPAVAPLPARTAMASPAEIDAGLLRKQLEEQRNLALRLESELRQLRAQGSSGGSSSRPVQNVASAQGQSSEEDDLAKLKAELERTRVDVARLGRKATFEDVIGLDAAKAALREAVIWPAIADPSLFAGIRGSPRGLLLYGPPGCGKTMLARAAAVELGSSTSFFHVRPGDIMSKFYGESQRRIQALEELISAASPAVVFLDEVDSLLGSRDAGSVAEHHRATTNALLAWMDGFGTGQERIFFLGATNRPEAIDEAALRRFGDAVEVEVPSPAARRELLKHLVQKAAVEGHQAELADSDLEVITSKTEGFSLADVDALVRKAFLQALRTLTPPGVRPGLRPSDVPPVTAAHFELALTESSGSSALKQMLRKRADTRSSL